MRDEAPLRLRLRAALERETDLRWACLFGSAARGADTPRDVDLAVMPAPGRFDDLVELGALAARLTTALDRTVDVVDLRDAPLSFVGPLLNERVLVLDRAPRERAPWEAERAVRWIDFRATWEQAERVRREALRRRLAAAAG
ncbi:MAG TPA: nucleotidyltransferase domain-containing protein [Myxococcota bacterium]|jgi:predicted nucleotidyltransferase|nr:nucleotidyltransferase domain-containing protein [Myxococcota bacterium]